MKNKNQKPHLPSTQKKWLYVNSWGKSNKIRNKTSDGVKLSLVCVYATFDEKTYVKYGYKHVWFYHNQQTYKFLI